MDVNYHLLLSKAVTGKDAASRDRIYKDAYNLIETSKFTREAALSHTAALERAIRQIEVEIDAEDQRSQAEITKVLSTGRSRTPLVIGALALLGVIAVSALLYEKNVASVPVGVNLTASSSKLSRVAEEEVLADLKAGIDGGSTGEALPFAYQRQVVFYRTTVMPGSIVVDRENHFLYLIDSNNSARRYGIGVALECRKGGSFFRIANKLEWPDRKTSDSNTEDFAALVPAVGRPGSPLGARALLLDKPGLLIHGTNSPKTVGHLVASGCIRLVNDDVEDLYRRVPLNTRVVFIG